MARNNWGPKVHFYPKFEELERPKSSVGIFRFTRENIILNFHFWKTINLHFYDFGPSGNYWESLQGLRVASRMPVGFFFPPKNLPPDFVGVFKTSKKVNKSHGTSLKNIWWKPHTTPFRFPPQHQFTPPLSDDNWSQFNGNLIAIHAMNDNQWQ